MKITEYIDEWFYSKFEETYDTFAFRMLCKLWFAPSNFIGKWYFRILVRGKCALKGCDVHYGSGWNLPDDVYEWWCSRCGAEGMNHIVYTYELFDDDTPLRNFIDALRGK